MTLRKAFIINKEKNPYYSSLVNFNSAVAMSKTNKSEVKEEFELLIERGDYHHSYKEQLLEYAFTLI